MASFKSRPLYLSGKVADSLWLGTLVEDRASLDILEPQNFLAPSENRTTFSWSFSPVALLQNKIRYPESQEMYKGSFKEKL